ncbi:MAG: hypothetical protein HQL40_13545, partial [Alphaproteobacteria bacterium]|nr:hypothetical protein [Alphaproteobacteria bacterium]
MIRPATTAQPILLWRETGPLRVAAGHLDLFSVRVAAGEPEGRRSFLLRLEGGQLALPLPLAADGDEALGVVAVAGLGGAVEDA